MKIRLKFRKYGTLKFIGHLDVMRYFQKANRRANVDVAYSGGFSPHQIMSFAMPLGIGLESNGEYVDMEINSAVSGRDLVDRLNAQMVEGMEIMEAKMLPENAGNAMASVAAAGYTIRFREGYAPNFDLETAIAAFMKQNEIEVTKQTKKSEITFDMKPFIYECHVCEDKMSIYMQVDASSANNIKPQLVISSLFEQNGVTLDEFGLLITREDTYLNIGTEETPEFAPLGSIGDDF